MGRGDELFWRGLAPASVTDSFQSADMHRCWHWGHGEGPMRVRLQRAPILAGRQALVSKLRTQGKRVFREGFSEEWVLGRF